MDLTVGPSNQNSRGLGHWVLDAYGATWFLTTNPDFWSHKYALSIAGAYRRFRGARQLRRQASAMGVARRQWLVRRSHQFERRRKLPNPGDKLPHRMTDMAMLPTKTDRELCRMPVSDTP